MREGYARRRNVNLPRRERPARRNPDAGNLDRIPARLHHLTLCRPQPSPHEPGEQLAAKAVAVHEQRLTRRFPCAA